MSIQDALRVAIRHHPSSLRALAKVCGVSTATLSRFMGRGLALHGDSIDRLAAFFGLHLTAIKGGPKA